MEDKLYLLEMEDNLYLLQMEDFLITRILEHYMPLILAPAEGSTHIHLALLIIFCSSII
jgi:hypothetical protein